MTIRLADRGVRVVLLDIEGTTTPIAFVHDVLFPFARARLASWWARARESADAVAIAQALAGEHADDVRRGARLEAWPHASRPTDAMLVEYLSWLMDRDRKSPALKHLQGLIWESGYQAGDLRGEVYPDVPGALRKWARRGISTSIYSSGSVLAQRRLFASTPYGDLTPFIAHHFDTGVGAKREVGSYTRIVSLLEQDAGAVLFISDVDAELVAAGDAGCQVLLSIRPGNPVQPNAEKFEAIRTFDEIE